MQPKATNVRTDKMDKFNAVSKALFALLGALGHHKITHTLVAKKAGVSRAWIYKYIGADKEDLIRFAIDHLGMHLTQRDMADTISTKEDLVKAICTGMQRMFENTQDYPWFVPVYFKYRGTDTAPGRSIAEVEQAYIRRQSKHFETHFSYPKDRALMASEILTAFRMGLAFSWQRGELSQKADQNKVMESVEFWMTELFMA